MLGVVHPNLAVHMRISRRDHRLLTAIVTHGFWQWKELKFFRDAVELRDAGLVHQTGPYIAGFIEFEIEIAIGIASGARSRIGELLHLAGLGVEPRQRVFAEV